VLLPLAGWLRLLPAWVSFTEAIERDPEAREVLGWIREMVREREFFLFFFRFLFCPTSNADFYSLVDFSSSVPRNSISTHSPLPRPSRESSSTSSLLLLPLPLTATATATTGEELP